jgi:hypothetical protein
VEPPLVIPAEAGTSGQEVSAGLPEVPASAGMTGYFLALKSSEALLMQ